MELKRCSGYKGHHECTDEYPDYIQPVENFSKDCYSKDGLNSKCRLCDRTWARIRVKKSNPLRKIYYELAGGMLEYYKLPKEDRNRLREKARGVEWKINGKVVSRTFKFDDEVGYSRQKEQIKRKRDPKVVSYIRSVYDLCSVVGCDYSEYDVAHIHALKHGADDLPENCLALCPNHHRDFDRGRMTPLRQLDVGGYIYFGEQGIKLKHKVDSKYLDQCNLELEEWKNAS